MMTSPVVLETTLHFDGTHQKTTYPSTLHHTSPLSSHTRTFLRSLKNNHSPQPCGHAYISDAALTVACGLKAINYLLDLLFGEQPALDVLLDEAFLIDKHAD